MQAGWEGIARDLLEGTGCDDPSVDAFELAACCDLEVRAKSGPASIVGDVIRVDMRTRRTRQHGQVAHELGHWALARAGCDDSEEGAIYVASALLLPRAHFNASLRATWDIPELMRRHPNAGAGTIARRICAMRGTIASVWDHHRAPLLLGRRRHHAPESWEAGLVTIVRETGRAYADETARAWLLPERPWRRVVVVREAA
ncbi:MAG: ImmA/IrrE family metallo-endopeptidase [Sandaracinaceae bacterium]|nr:ImmA/IrrE family metallo-endopeptidase [Sandaracinaceae bacterium]